MLNCIHKHIRRYLGSVSLAFLVAGIIPVILSADMVFVAAAHADDDDAGDDSGSDDSGGSSRSGSDSGRRFSGPKTLMDYLENRKPAGSKVRAAKTVKRKQTPLTHEPQKLVALGLNDETIAQLIIRGFRVDDQTAISLTNGQLVRLQIPPRMALDTARRQVAELAPAAVVDLSHYYRPEQSAQTSEPKPAPQTAMQHAASCEGSDCTLMRHLIGWEQPDTGSQVCSVLPKIGLIDTAINPDHEALKASQIETIRLSAADLPQSSTQHGTAVAALLVGAAHSRAPGLLPQAHLIAIDAFHSAKGDESRATTYDLVRAIDLLADKQVTLINMSLSGPHNLLLEKTVEAAAQRRMLLVAAAGNNGPHAKPVYPAAYESVIAVTAVDRNKAPYRRAVRGHHIDLAAPGVGVWTAASVSGTRQKTGTSFAAPFVTAAVARLKAAQPELDNRQIAEKLTKLATDMGTPGHDPVFGWGLLDARSLCSS